MPFDAGTCTVSAAGTAEKLSDNLSASATVRASSAVRVLWLRAHTDNGGDIYFGRSTVSNSYGTTLAPGDALEINLEPGTEQFASFYVDAEQGNDKVDWMVVFETRGRS